MTNIPRARIFRCEIANLDTAPTMTSGMVPFAARAAPLDAKSIQDRDAAMSEHRLVPSGVVIAGAIVALEVYLAWVYRSVYRPLFNARPALTAAR